MGEASSFAEQFCAICVRLGIRIVPTRRIPRAFRGPRAAGCDPATRRVFVPRSWANPRSSRGIENEPETYLHEAMHVLMQPPGEEIENLSEEWILFQVERQVARVAMPAALPRVLRWQLDTEVHLVLYHEPLERYPTYQRDPVWRRGYDLARRLGVLDAHRRPTWRWPDWTQLTPEERAEGRIGW